MKNVKNKEKYGDMFFKSGKKAGQPKKKYMKCYDPQYLAEIRRINGDAIPGRECAGCGCPYYSIGCES